jgi:hypothetical protein
MSKTFQRYPSKPVILVVFSDPDAWIAANFKDLTWDSVSAVYPIGEFVPEGGTLFRDSEEGSEKTIFMDDLAYALQLLCGSLGTTLHVGGLTSPLQLRDPGNWDAEVVDAFFQLAYHREVIYG